MYIFKTEHKCVDRLKDKKIIKQDYQFSQFENYVSNNWEGKNSGKTIISDGLSLFQTLLGLYPTCTGGKGIIIALDFVSKNE